MRLFLAILALFLTVSLPAQQLPLGTFTDAYRADLASRWDTTHAYQNERAECILYNEGTLKNGQRYVIVYGGIPARMDSAGTNQVRSSFHCPVMERSATLHTHPPTTCFNGKCEIGGLDSYSCQPSPTDIKTIRSRKDLFGVVQCDRNAMVFAWNPDSLAIPSSGNKKKLLIFGGALGAGVAAVAIWKLDPDHGGYHDGWFTKAQFPDKLAHSGTAFLLTSIGVDLKLKPWQSALLVSAAGVGYEYAQGYVSKYDIAADVSGAVLAALWRTWKR